jgi:hypothetical protein
MAGGFGIGAAVFAETGEKSAVIETAYTVQQCGRLAELTQYTCCGFARRAANAQAEYDR